MTLAKRIASAAIQLMLSNALVRLLSLITMPILTHLLAPSAYGAAAMAGTLISLVSVFALAGMDMSYVRAYHSNSPTSGRFVESFAWRFALSVGIVSGVGVFACWRLIASAFSLPGYLGGLVGAGVVLSLAHTMAQARARLNNRYRAMSISTVVSGLGTAAVSIGVACWWRQDELPLILSMVAGYLIPVLILGLPPIAQLGKPSGLNLSGRRGILKIGLAGTVTAPAYWVLSSSDRWFLGYFEGASSVGIYSMGYSVAIMGMMANTAVLSVWTPEVVREFEINSDQARVHLGSVAERLVVGFACVWLAITAAGGDVIRLLAAPAFHDSATLVPYIAAGVFFHGVIHLANANLLLMKRLSYSMWWWIAGGVFCILLNLVLVPWLGMLGAALTQTFSFALIAGGIVLGAQKIYPLQLNGRRLGLVLAGVLVTGISMFPAWGSTPTLSLLLKLPVGALAVVAVFRLIAPEVLLWASRQSAVAIRRG